MPARKLAGLIGKIISMSIGLGPVTRLMTSALCATLYQKVASLVPEFNFITRGFTRIRLLD